MTPFHGKNEDNLVRRLEDLVAPLDKLRIALNVSNQAILVFDGNRLSYLNRVAEDLLGLSESEVCGLPLQEIKISGPVQESLIRVVRATQESSGAIYEKIALHDKFYILCAKLSAGAISLVTIEPQGPSAPNDSKEASVVQDTLLKVAQTLSREVPAGGEASYLCRQILGLLASLDANNSFPKENSTFSKLSDIGRDLTALVRYSLPSTVKVVLDLPSADSDTLLPGEKLRRLGLKMLLGASAEIGELGELRLSIREGEDSVVLEVEALPRNTLGKVDEGALKLTRRLAEDLGGHLVVWSEAERRVRLANIPTGSPKDESHSVARSKLQGKGKTVLLIDDEDAIRAVGRTALTRIGYKVLLAKDGIEGVDVYKANQGKISLVLLDLVMPRLGGAGCFEQLKELDPDVKVVLMSGFTRNNRVNDLMSKGCLYFLRKPFELSDLISITKEVTGEE